MRWWVSLVWVTIFAALAIGIIALVLIVAYDRLNSKPTVKVESPAYSTGDCLKPITEEEWAEAKVYRVERVGKRNYLLRQYPWNHWKPVEGITAPFSVAEDVLEKVECPTITG